MDLFKSKFPSAISSKPPFPFSSRAQGGAASSSLKKSALAFLMGVVVVEGRGVGTTANDGISSLSCIPRPCCENTPPLRSEETVCLTLVHLVTPGREQSAHTGSVLLIHGEKGCLFKHFFAFFFSLSAQDSLTSHMRPTFNMRVRVCSLLNIYLDFPLSDF